MAILAQCPICRTRQSNKRKICKCGEDLDKAKRSKRVKYWVSYYVQGKQYQEYVGSDTSLNGFSIVDAQKAHSKRISQKAEKRFMDILPDNKLTFQELTDWYLGLEKVKALASFETKQIYMRKFNREFGDRDVGEIKSADLENLQIQRINEGNAPKTADDEIDYIQTAVIKAFDNDMISGDTLKPFRKTKKLLSGKKRFSNTRSRTLSLPEIKAIAGALTDPYTLDYFLLGYWTGMRAGEIIKLRWSMIDFQKRIISLSAKITKEEKAKVVPIGDEVYKILTRDKRHIHWAGANDLVFIHDDRNAKRFFTRRLRDSAKAVNIAWGREVEGGWIFHDLRRTFKTDMRKAGVAKIVYDAIVGHSSNDMDSRYNIVDNSDLREAIGRLEDYRKFPIINHSINQTAEIEGKETVSH